MKKISPGINLQRLRNDLENLARIGLDPDSGGVTRPSFSDADIQARDWLLQRMQSAGMDARMDSVGNVIGRWNAAASGPALGIGSHLDSVPQGGRFDGVLGVIAGLEVVRSIQDAGITPAHPIEVIATSEEEGRFGGMLGSQALTGELKLDWLMSASDDDGILLKDVMLRQGLDPKQALHARRADDLSAFLELHIEQGPVLEQRNIPIGIVEGIAGVFHWSISLSGQSNHAGTTPMELRRDAFLALADFAHAIPEIIRDHGSANSRLTIGKVDLSPGFAHTVPGQADFTLVGKDFANDDLRNLAAGCRSMLQKISSEHGVGCQVNEVSFLDSQPCDQQVIETIQGCADELELPCLKMFSGAGHDTQILARHIRTGMIFVPSIGGISHDPEEQTEWSDIEKGVTLLLHASLRLCAGE